MVHQYHHKTKIIYLILTLRAFKSINTALMRTLLALNVIISGLMFIVSMFKLSFAMFKINHSSFSITSPCFNIISPALKPQIIVIKLKCGIKNYICNHKDTKR